jgi:anti-anti-sigma regulatory factor
MNFKIDTKEKFTVVTPIVAHFSDNVAVDLVACCNEILQKEVKNVILNLQNVTTTHDVACETLTQLQQDFYEKNASFVICEMKPEIEDIFDNLELTDVLNITPSESEAWDIVQMEEIERELLDSDDIEFEKNDD